MRPIILFLALAGAGIITWLIVARPDKKTPEPKLQAISVSKHSDAFNQAISKLLTIYSSVEEELVKWDSVAVKEKSIGMKTQLDELKLDELQKDTAIYITAQSFVDNAKSDLETIANETRIKQQREAFNNLTDNMKQFINTVKYDREKLYLQECTMAFGDEKPAYWLSKSAEDEQRRNPYMGLHHPEYGKGMLTCGTTKQTINYTGAD